MRGAWVAAGSLWRLETRKVEVQTKRAVEAVRLKSLRGSRNNRLELDWRKPGIARFRIKCASRVPSGRTYFTGTLRFLRGCVVVITFVLHVESRQFDRK